jgi:hypothetical protein
LSLANSLEQADSAGPNNITELTNGDTSTTTFNVTLPIRKVVNPSGTTLEAMEYIEPLAGTSGSEPLIAS